MRNLSVQMQKAIEADVTLIDVIHGELKNLMYEWENKELKLIYKIGRTGIKIA